MKKERRFQNVPVRWYLILPLAGVAHTLLDRFGWIEQGSWPSFLLLLGVVFLWIAVVLKETGIPFTPLVWIGSIYGGMVALIDFLSWLLFREPLGLAESGWAFGDLLTAVDSHLRPVFQIAGNLLFGIFLGVLAGFTAYMILKFQQKRR